LFRTDQNNDKVEVVKTTKTESRNGNSVIFISDVEGVK